jgi:hypothetical protein
MDGDRAPGLDDLRRDVRALPRRLRAVVVGGKPAESATGLAQNMEGKEVRLGVMNSVLWSTATPTASNGR